MKNLLFLVPVDPQPHYIESSGRWCWPLPPRACFPGCCTEVVTASREWWEYAPSEAKPHPHAEGVRLRDDLWYWAVPGTELNATPGATLPSEASIPSEASRPRELLVRALKLMTDFHATFSHDEDDPELTPRTTPAAFRDFVDQHARLLYEEHHLPAARPTAGSLEDLIGQSCEECAFIGGAHKPTCSRSTP